MTRDDIINRMGRVAPTVTGPLPDQTMTMDEVGLALKRMEAMGGPGFSETLDKLEDATEIARLQRTIG